MTGIEDSAAAAMTAVQASFSAHGAREGEAPTVLLAEGATQAPVTGFLKRRPNFKGYNP